jgi:hypothetical protein
MKWMRRPQVIALLVMLLPTLAEAGASQSASIRRVPALVPGAVGFLETVAATIPVGNDPTQISDAPVECCQDPTAGCAFLGQDGRLYFHDWGHQNLKVVEFVRGRAARVRVLPGPAGRNPVAGAADREGNIYLVSGWQPSGICCTLHCLPVGAATWQNVDFPSEAGQYVLGGVFSSCQLELAMDPSGEVCLVSLDVTRSSLGVAGGGRIYSRSEFHRIPLDGVEVAPGRLVAFSDAGATIRSVDSLGVHDLATIRGQWLGADSLGRSYFETWSGSESEIEMRDRDGRLVAKAVRPMRPMSMMIEPGKFGFVTPDGSLLIPRMTGRALLVYRWTPEAGRRPMP